VMTDDTSRRKELGGASFQATRLALTNWCLIHEFSCVTWTIDRRCHGRSDVLCEWIKKGERGEVKLQGRAEN
jgi:hypothetical protein